MPTLTGLQDAPLLGFTTFMLTFKVTQHLEKDSTCNCPNFWKLLKSGSMSLYGAECWKLSFNNSNISLHLQASQNVFELLPFPAFMIHWKSLSFTVFCLLLYKKENYNICTILLTGLFGKITNDNMNESTRLFVTYCRKL